MTSTTSGFQQLFHQGAHTSFGSSLYGCSMKKAALLSIVLCFFLGLIQAQSSQPPATSQPQPQLPQTQIMKVDDVRPGMKGVGYTVFQGVKPEPMGVEVLGVLRNLNGP